MTSDGDLVRETLAGRNAAYEELVHRWTPRILALCHSRVARGGMAEDLAQEALCRGYVALKTLSDPERFGPWLHGIATRVCLDWLKAKARTQVMFTDLGGERSPESFLQDPRGEASDPERDLEAADELQRILAQVEALPEELRKVILLFYYEDLTYKDIADICGVSPATINMRLTKARALIRHRLGAVAPRTRAGGAP